MKLLKLHKKENSNNVYLNVAEIETIEEIPSGFGWCRIQMKTGSIVDVSENLEKVKEAIGGTDFNNTVETQE